MFKKFERLVLLGVIERANNSEWGAPYFAQPKPKTDQVCFLNDFRSLNKPLKRKPHPMSKINEMLLKSQGFKYATSLDLNMEYYHIQRTEDASNLCAIVIPWRKYRCKRLPMGVSNLPAIFSRK